MSPTANCILGLVAWTGLLVVWLVGWRTWLTLSGKRAANSFGVDGADVSPLAARLCRAHANCYEHVPFALAVMLLAVATDQTAVTDPLAPVLLGARVAQSSIHIASTSWRAVSVRAVFLMVQIGVVAAWVVGLLA